MLRNITNFRNILLGLLVFLLQATAAAAQPAMLLVLLQGETAYAFTVEDSRQEQCFDTSGRPTTCPGADDPLYGQDAQHQSPQPHYVNNGDGTVSDQTTGLTWQQSPDLQGDGDIDAADKLTSSQALNYCERLELGGHDDWRLPSITELYSLFDARGTDPMSDATSTSSLTPFIDTDFFAFGYGDLAAGERIIDAQYASSSLYVAANHLFGVNFADGRIKGYNLIGANGYEKTFYTTCVRGDSGFGSSDFRDNGDGTVTDLATGLEWTQQDSGYGMDWYEALRYAQACNAQKLLGHDDWRLPEIKELQSIVDYSRSPDTTGSAAIEPVFASTAIVNEAGWTDYPFYWSSTTHVRWDGSGDQAMYVAFGRGLGYMFGSWVDVHGAGCQRSDPKTGDPSDYPYGLGPQGDARRIYNFVRLVRDA